MATMLIGDLSSPTEHPRAHVLTDRCAGCQECVVRCPTGALTMDHQRWVAVADDERCVGCRQCVRTCPFSAITVSGPLVVAPRRLTVEHHPDPLDLDVSEVRRGLRSWDEALAEAERCLACPDPTCVRGCPAHNDIPGFISAVRDRDLPLAHEILRRTTVLPDVCARVCNQAAQCEGACTWSLAGGEPVAIGQLERFVTERQAVPGPRVGGGTGVDPLGQTSTDLSVGIVGSGPGGIGAAWPLLEAGASVTVYERDELPGGLLRWGIPDFTLPEEVAGRAWRQLEAAGADLRCGVEIDATGLRDLLDRHDAVIVAAGAGAPIRLPIPGADLEGVVDATAFLTSAHSALGSHSALESPASVEEWRAAMGVPASDHRVLGRAPRVLVLGAGNTAMDVARTARRLGLDATCVDWLDERFALARPDELAEARAEGVEIRFGRTVTKLEGDGPRVGRALLTRTRQERATEAPHVLSKEPPDVVEVDLVVMAMGYRIDQAYGALLQDGPVRRQATGLPDRKWVASGVLANPASAAANRSPVGQLALGREVGIRAAALPVQERLWFVGDALVGPSTVVEAMAQGRRAAASLMAAGPARPGRPRRERSTRALVCYESRGGRTAAIARQLGDLLYAEGVRVQVLPLDRVGPDELATADLVVAGTWVEGLVVAKVGPAKATTTWLGHLPRLAGRPVGLFCTYAVNPRGTLDLMARGAAERGGEVVATAAFGRGDPGRLVADFAGRLLASVESPRGAASCETARLSAPVVR